jgi:AcrR family transcriptional regulator
MAPIPDDPLGEQILAAAALVFAEAGVRGASLDAVAERAHVSPQTVRRRWAGKEALALAVIDRDLRIELGDVDQRIAERDTIADPDTLREVMARLIHSLLLAPSSAAPLTSRESTADYMRRCLVPLVRSVGTA